MATIKERRDTISPKDYINVFEFLTEISNLELECEQTLGHINLGISTREDGSHFYICDECRKQIELNYY